MTAYDDDAALMADLMHGPWGRIASSDKTGKLTARELREMDEIIDHLRAQIIAQAGGMREWRARHTALRSKLARDYSAYEGLFARHHLRLYWILYRRALRQRRESGAGKSRLWAV